MSDMIPEAVAFFQEVEQLAKRYGLAAFIVGAMFERDGDALVYGNGGARLDPTLDSSGKAMKRLGGMTEDVTRRFLAVYSDAQKPRILN